MTPLQRRTLQTVGLRTMFLELVDRLLRASSHCGAHRPTRPDRKRTDKLSHFFASRSVLIQPADDRG